MEKSLDCSRLSGRAGSKSILFEFLFYNSFNLVLISIVATSKELAIMSNDEYCRNHVPKLLSFPDEILSLIFTKLILRGRELCCSFREQMLKCGTPDDPIVVKVDLRGSESTFNCNQVNELNFLGKFENLVVNITTDRVGLHFSRTMLQLQEISSKASREMKIRGNWMGSTEVEHLARGLQCLPMLQTLDLCGNGLGRCVRGVEFLSNGLRHLTDLASLHVRDNFIEMEGAAQLANGLENLSKLTCLDLGYNNIGAEGSGLIANGLQFTKRLEFLDIRNNFLLAEGAAQISRALEYLPMLSTLILCHNDFGPAGMEYLATGLKHLSALTSLDVSDNHMGQSGAEHLAKGLGGNQTLVSIDVGWNELRRAGAVQLADVLANKVLLTTVSLEGNRIGSIGAEDVTMRLRHLRSLKTINFRSVSSARPEPVHAPYVPKS